MAKVAICIGAKTSEQLLTDGRIQHKDEMIQNVFSGKSINRDKHHHTPKKSMTYVPPYSKESIAILANRLDAQSIDFLIKALK